MGSHTRISVRTPAIGSTVGSTFGFTVIELLVVIGILAALAGILLPAVARARGAALRVAMQADLQTVVLALDAYRSDFGDFPRPDRFVTSPFQGSAIICWALIAPGPATQDGADGPGFRLRGTYGQVKGPYVSIDSMFF